MTDQIDWDDFFYQLFRVLRIFAVVVLAVTLFAVAFNLLTSGATDGAPVVAPPRLSAVVPATVRTSDPNPPNGFRRVNMDGCIYYWRDHQAFRGAGDVEHVIQPFFVHAAGCTNHPCAQTVLQLEK